MAADPIWLQNLKRLFGQSISSERITPERPEFTGRTGYNQRRGQPLDPHTIGFVPELWTHPQSLEWFGGPWGSKVDPHLAAAAGGPGWGSGMAPSTMTKVPASAGSSKWKKVIEQLGKMTGPEPDWGLAGQRVGPPTAWAHTNIPYAPTAGLMGFKKKKEGPY